MIAKMDAARTEALQKLAAQLGVTFRDLALLQLAMTHTSFANEAHGHVESSERLEFLGDAVLELAVSTYLYQRYPEMPEGQLTKVRASIVCSATLAELATQLHLGDYLLLGHGEEMGGGRTRQTNLEDVFECVIGAVYLDQGWPAANAYVRRQLAPQFAQVSEGDSVQKDYKTQLQEVVFRQPHQSVEYVELAESGPDHDKRFRFQVVVTGQVLGEGLGHSKKEAQQHAARLALQKLQKA